MYDILSIISPLFIAIAVGFIFVKFGLFNKSDVRVLGRFVIQVALPALLFKALSERQFTEIINVQFFLAYALGSVFSLSICVYIASLSKTLSKTSLAMIGLGTALSNSGFIGFPLVIQYLGPDATVAIALSLTIENLIIFPIVIIMAESAGQQNKGAGQLVVSLAKSLLKNPLIIAIVLGFISSLLQIRLPAIAAKVIDMFAAASGVVALFVIGGTLVGLKVTTNLPRIAWVTFGKLIIHPLAVSALLLVFTPQDPMLRTAAVVIAALPMLSIFPIIGQKYDEEEWTASTLLVATVTSFFTLSAVLLFLS